MTANLNLLEHESQRISSFELLFSPSKCKKLPNSGFWRLQKFIIPNKRQNDTQFWMANFELLCTMIPQPWCDGSLLSASACLCHKSMVHLHLRALVTTRPWFICCRSYVLPLKTIHLHLGFSAPSTPTTTWFICSYVPSLLLRDHVWSVVTFICSYVYVHHLQLRPSEVLYLEIWAFYLLRRLDRVKA